MADALMTADRLESLLQSLQTTRSVGEFAREGSNFVAFYAARGDGHTVHITPAQRTYGVSLFGVSTTTDSVVRDEPIGKLFIIEQDSEEQEAFELDLILYEAVTQIEELKEFAQTEEDIASAEARMDELLGEMQQHSDECDENGGDLA